MIYAQDQRSHRSEFIGCVGLTSYAVLSFFIAEEMAPEFVSKIANATNASTFLGSN